jgi:hypothetical protein
MAPTPNPIANAEVISGQLFRIIIGSFKLLPSTCRSALNPAQAH